MGRVTVGAIVGIDLGTSNTVVAHTSDDGTTRALADDTKDILIPSVAAFHPSGAVLVGKQARERRLQDQKNTIFSAKRLIGRPWSSKEVKEARVRLPYDLREGKNDSVVVVARNTQYTLPEISAFVLRKARLVAEAALLTKVERAVVTCPANFDELQRAATKLAGKLAGLDVVRVLSEPTAAALAYGHGKRARERVLVYDFGGGTFDVTIIDIDGGTFRVLSTAGDMYLGGDDVDLAIAQRVAEGFARTHFYDPRADKQVFEHVRVAAENLKIQLSSAEKASVGLNDVMFGPGGKSLKFDYEMTRAELDALAEPFVVRTLRVCKRALDAAQMTPKDIDQILLVGGSTRLTRVRQRVSEHFAREPASGVSPDEAIAIGAAIQASAMKDGALPVQEAPPPSRAAAIQVRSEIATLAPPAEAAVPPPAAPPPAPPPAIKVERIPEKRGSEPLSQSVWIAIALAVALALTLAVYALVHGSSG